MHPNSYLAVAEIEKDRRRDLERPSCRPGPSPGTAHEGTGQAARRVLSAARRLASQPGPVAQPC